MFTGEMMDANELVYLRARYYSPGLGVFASLDPVEGVNRYQYVGANPTNLVDPSGMIAETPGLWNNCYRQDDPCTECCENTYANRTLDPLPPADEAIQISNCVRDCLNMPGHFCRHRSQNGCAIQIAGFEAVPPIPAYHLFIIFTDELGNEFAYRGGPQGGLVFAETYPSTGTGVSGQNDFEAIERTANSRLLLSAGPEACEKRSCLEREIERIKKSHTPYCATGPTNSNTVVSALLESCNLLLLKPDYASWTPGWREADFVGDTNVKCWSGMVEQPDWWP